MKRWYIDSVPVSEDGCRKVALRFSWASVDSTELSFVPSTCAHP